MEELKSAWRIYSKSPLYVNHGCFPSPQKIRAVEIGADELVSRAEWALRHHPRTLRNVRRAHVRLCVFVRGQ